MSAKSNFLVSDLQIIETAAAIYWNDAYGIEVLRIDQTS